MIIVFRTKRLMVSLFLSLINMAVLADTTSDPLPALQAANWHEATHAILLEARGTVLDEPFLPRQFAQDGFPLDAIESARMLCQACQPSALVDIVSASTTMPIKEKEVVLNEAIAKLRAGPRQPAFRSGTLTRMALQYSIWGSDSEAHSIFDEALSSAVADPASSPGYDYIAFSLDHAAPENIPEWMVSSLAKAIERSPSPDDAALGYLDLARLRVRQKQPESEIDFMGRALTACGAMANFGQAQSIRSSVGRLALDSDQVAFAQQRVPSSLTISANALYEARKGNKDAALRYLSELQGPTLYVDHRGETLRDVIREASSRGDFSSARFFAGQVDPQMTGMQIELWTIIAKAEWLKGDSKTSQLDFRKALSIVESIPIQQRQASIEQEGELAEAMAKAGLREDSLHLSQSTKISVMALPDRQTDKRVIGMLLLASAFHAAGDDVDAKQNLILAYQNAHGFQSNNQYGTKKSGLLMHVASVTESFH
jgi:hypothetical protein